METKNRSIQIDPIKNGFLVRTSWETGKDDYHNETQYASTLAKALKMVKGFLTIEDGNVIPF